MTKISGFISEEEYEQGYTTLYHGTDARMVAMSVDERKMPQGQESDTRWNGT